MSSDPSEIQLRCKTCPACNPCNNGNTHVRRCDENARYRVRHPNAAFKDGFLVAVFRVDSNTKTTVVDIIVMTQSEFTASGLPVIHSMFRIRPTHGNNVHSTAGMALLPEIVENMNGRLHRGFTYSVKLPDAQIRHMGGSDCQFMYQWKENQNCRGGWHPTPKRADGGWNKHCGSCCFGAKWEWSCFQHRWENRKIFDWSYTPFRRDAKGSEANDMKLGIVHLKDKDLKTTCATTTSTVKFTVSRTITHDKKDYTVYLSAFKEDMSEQKDISVDYKYYDYSKNRAEAYRYKYDNISFTRMLWNDKHSNGWPAELAIEKIDGGRNFAPLGCETILPDGSIGGLQYTKNSVIVSEKLPNKYQITKDRVPIYNGKYRSPYLLCYSNLVYPSLNVGIVGKPSWTQIHKNATELLTTIRSDKRKNKGWSTELKSMGATSDKLDKLCVVITGNSTEMWALAYIASNGVGDPQKNDDGKKFVSNIGPAISGDPPYSHGTFYLEDFITVNIPFEDPLITEEQGVSAASAWYCYLPLEDDCKYNNDTVEKLAGDFCTPRAADVKNNENGVCVSIYNDMSDDTRDTITNLYCNANPKSTDCQCEQRGRFKTFQDLIKTGGAGDHDADANTACWWRPCKLANSSMFVRQVDLPTHCTATSCINAFNVSNSENISLDNYKQIATCGDKTIVPGGGTTPTPTPGGGGVSDNTGGGVDSTTMKVLGGVMVALLIIAIGLGLYFFSSGTRKDKVVVKSPLLEKGPITKKVVKPVVKPKPAPKPVIKPVAKPVVKPVAKPAPKPVINPVAPKPVVNPVAPKPVTNVTVPPADATKQTVGLPKPNQV